MEDEVVPKPEGKRPVGRPVHRRIILGWILENRVGRSRVDGSDLG